MKEYLKELRVYINPKLFWILDKLIKENPEAPTGLKTRNQYRGHAYLLFKERVDELLAKH